MGETLLDIRNLVIHYETDDGVVQAVNGIDLSIDRGEILGLVGETGAGKTTTALGIMRLVPDPPGRVVDGMIMLDNEDLLKKSEISMRAIRGNAVSMVFQDPMTSLNPVLTIGDQIAEVIRLHKKISRAEAHMRAADLLQVVGIPADRLGEYPHQFSGGMKQRVVIAIAIACNPDLLIADEPTTALDVTIQAQVLTLIERLTKELRTSVLLITHDLGVVAEICNKVAIMYAGQIVEQGTLEDVYNRTNHPYSIGLFDSIPSLDKNVARLKPIMGLMPDPMDLPTGCAFNPRCSWRIELCEMEEPVLAHVSETHFVRCHRIKHIRGGV